jgi:hypothetical protein
MFMGELSLARSLKQRPIRLGQHRRLRLVLGVLTAAALAVSILATTGTGVSQAGESERDTIALVDSQGHFTVLSSVSEDARTTRYTFGHPGDVPLMGDWDCDGDETPGVYRLSSGGVFLRNSHSGGNADVSFLFGNPGDRAISGDFDGDGCDTVSVYRSHRATAFVRNLIASGDADMFFLFGNRGDRSFVGDFNGNGTDTIGLHRNSTGTVYLANENRTSNAVAVAYGNPNDQILAGDWNGDGSDTIAAYRPSTGMFYFRNSNSTGSGDGSLFVGRGLTVVPVAGIDSGSIEGDIFDPGSSEPVAPAPEPSAPAPSTPPPSGDVGPVAGFDEPPARQASGPIDISGESNVVIENLHISNPGGVCVYVSGSSDVVIKNSTIGPCGDEAVYVTDSDSVQVYGNYITDTNNGVLIHRSDSIVVDENAFINAGRNFVQFDKVNGPGSSISGNRGQNELGGSNAEDMINLYQSNGTASSPIRIVGNYLRNGGPSDYGSGIMLGDNGGSHQFVEGNVMVDPGQVGIGVASGQNITVLNNLIYSSSQPWSNVGLYVWNQYSSACSDIEIAGNQVNWTAAGGYSNGFWSGGGCSNTSVYDNDWDAPIGPDIF